jgi:hypothetical protein
MPVILRSATPWYRKRSSKGRCALDPRGVTVTANEEPLRLYFLL